MIEVKQKGKVGYNVDMFLERQDRSTLPGNSCRVIYYLIFQAAKPMDPVLTGYTCIRKTTWKTLLLPFFALYTYLLGKYFNFINPCCQQKFPVKGIISKMNVK